MTLQANTPISHTLTRIGLVASFITGISFSYLHYWSMIPVLLSLLLFMAFCKIDRTLFTWTVILFCIGYIRLQQQLYYYHKAVGQIATNKPIHIKGTVTDIAHVQHRQYSYIISLYITHQHEQNEDIPYKTPWYLQCYTKQMPAYAIGDTLELQDIKISRQKKNSFAHYLIKEGIHASTFLRYNAYRIIKHLPGRISSLLHTYKQKLLKNIKLKCSPTTYALVASIFFGNRLCVKAQYTKLKDIFGGWGIIHFLARSGLHLIIFIVLLHTLLQWAPAPFLFKQGCLIGISLLYAMLTWSSISFYRALMSFLWYKACVILGYQIDTVHIILLLMCAFLLINPMLLFFLDFQLSFGLTLVLAITNQYLTKQKHNVA